MKKKENLTRNFSFNSRKKKNKKPIFEKVILQQWGNKHRIQKADFTKISPIAYANFKQESIAIVCCVCVCVPTEQ